MPNALFTEPAAPCPKRVLLVDQSDDARDVIRTILERRGVEIFEAPTARAGLELMRPLQPHVIVLDLETPGALNNYRSSGTDQELAGQQAEIVILGNLRRDQQPSRQHVVRTPYHYGPLIQMIEELARRSQQSAPSETRGSADH